MLCMLLLMICGSPHRCIGKVCKSSASDCTCYTFEHEGFTAMLRKSRHVLRIKCQARRNKMQCILNFVFCAMLRKVLNYPYFPSHFIPHAKSSAQEVKQAFHSPALKQLY